MKDALVASEACSEVNLMDGTCNPIPNHQFRVCLCDLEEFEDKFVTKDKREHFLLHLIQKIQDGVNNSLPDGKSFRITYSNIPDSDINIWGEIATISIYLEESHDHPSTHQSKA